MEYNPNITCMQLIHSEGCRMQDAGGGWHVCVCVCVCVSSCVCRHVCVVMCVRVSSCVRGGACTWGDPWSLEGARVVLLFSIFCTGTFDRPWAH